MQQKNLVLILARELADKLATAMILVDHEGSLVYFNEAAAAIIGQTFAEAGTRQFDQWSRNFSPADVEGRALGTEELPLMVALRHRRPAHLRLQIESLDGEKRQIAATAFPLFAREDEFVGAAAIFWTDGDEAGGGVG